jgi:hypothetical protein
MSFKFFPALLGMILSYESVKCNKNTTNGASWTALKMSLGGSPIFFLMRFPHFGDRIHHILGSVAQSYALRRAHHQQWCL